MNDVDPHKKIRIYHWKERLLGVIEIHSPQLFKYLKAKGITIDRQEWLNAPAEHTLEGLRPGLVSVSRSHWGKHPADTPEWAEKVQHAWRRDGLVLKHPNFYDPPTPDAHFISRLARGCKLNHHIPFSRDQVLREDGQLGPWEELQAALEAAPFFC